MEKSKKTLERFSIIKSELYSHFDNEKRFMYLHQDYSEKHLFIARTRFSLLIRLLFSDKPNVYLSMDLDEVIRIVDKGRFVASSSDFIYIKEAYSFYVRKYIDILTRYIKSDLDVSTEEFMVNAFVNSIITDFISGGTRDINLLSLKTHSLHYEADYFFRRKIIEANNVFSNLTAIKPYTNWQSDYNDKLFDISLICNREISDMCYTSAKNIGCIVTHFRDTLRDDKFDW